MWWVATPNKPPGSAIYRWLTNGRHLRHDGMLRNPQLTFRKCEKAASQKIYTETGHALNGFGKNDFLDTTTTNHEH